jgi:hypothetical protein
MASKCVKKVRVIWLFKMVRLCDRDRKYLIYRPFLIFFSSVWTCIVWTWTWNYDLFDCFIREMFLFHQRNWSNVIEIDQIHQKLIKCGVPQSSILGALFFMLYINDLLQCLDKTKPRLFADDTNLTVSGDSITYWSWNCSEFWFGKT